eukprot:GEMP01132318.1.p1 GENE.GEMP01132318.1~~GEMP01132318.1.p1  ORF type:complete len:159 (-),score=1.32 GEMP01132318.1:5-481(-)
MKKCSTLAANLSRRRKEDHLGQITPISCSEIDIPAVCTISGGPPPLCSAYILIISLGVYTFWRHKLNEYIYNKVSLFFYTYGHTYKTKNKSSQARPVKLASRYQKQFPLPNGSWGAPRWLKGVVDLKRTSCVCGQRERLPPSPLRQKYQATDGKRPAK